MQGVYRNSSVGVWTEREVGANKSKVQRYDLDHGDSLPISSLAGYCVNGLRKTLDVARRYPSYGYPAVFSGVYRVLS